MDINNHGGTIPANERERSRAEQVDLVTLPVKVEGTNCGNCKFISGAQTLGVDRSGNEVSGGFCNHPKVYQEVTNRMCCALWDSPGTLRDF